MSIIAVFSAKGGTGKSTTAATLARLWREKSPLLLDMDKQQASLAFEDSLQDVVRVDGSRKETDIPGILGASRLGIVDCPPDWDVAVDALKCADLVIIPCLTEAMSFRTAMTTLRDMDALQHRPLVRVLLTRFNVFEADAREVRDVASEGFEGRVFGVKIPSSRAIRTAPMQGKCVLDFAPDDKGAKAYRLLAREIESLLGSF